jgi:hypothetical protein
MLLVEDVISRSLLGISQNRVGLKDYPKSALIASLLIVWMEPTRQQPVDTIDRAWLGVSTDLQHFVIIVRDVFIHTSEFIVGTLELPSVSSQIILTGEPP